jgi:hypothetical protein
VARERIGLQRKREKNDIPDIGVSVCVSGEFYLIIRRLIPELLNSEQSLQAGVKGS